MAFDTFLAIVSLSFMVPFACAEEADPKELIKEVIEEAGGEEKLLDIFQLRERVLITATPAEKVTEDEKGNRTSVIQVAGDWWINGKKRDKDKVRVLCWAWSLRILLDTKSKIQSVPEIKVDDKPAFGLQVTETVKTPIHLYFDKETKRLVAIDYDDTRHIFSDWKKTEDGYQYPSHVVGFRFEDRETRTLKEQQWYQTDIIELTPLKELPTELKE